MCSASAGGGGRDGGGGGAKSASSFSNLTKMEHSGFVLKIEMLLVLTSPLH